MLFRVCRTSVCDYSKKPYEDCIPIMVKRIDRRRFSSPEEFNEICGKREGNWFDTGKNHRVEDGCIVRDLEPVQNWGIEINSLEELIEFKNKVENKIIIHDDITAPRLEIYDDYRE